MSGLEEPERKEKKTDRKGEKRTSVLGKEGDEKMKKRKETQK